jgi:hypothetical protein
MLPLENEAFVALKALGPLLPPRIKPLWPKLLDLAKMVLDGDPVPADYLQSMLDLGEADLEGQAAAKFGST